jgi:hypothetical protein
VRARRLRLHRRRVCAQLGAVAERGATVGRPRISHTPGWSCTRLTRRVRSKRRGRSRNPTVFVGPEERGLPVRSQWATFSASLAYAPSAPSRPARERLLRDGERRAKLRRGLYALVTSPPNTPERQRDTSNHEATATSTGSERGARSRPTTERDAKPSEAGRLRRSDGRRGEARDARRKAATDRRARRANDGGAVRQERRDQKRGTKKKGARVGPARPGCQGPDGQHRHAPPARPKRQPQPTLDPPVTRPATAPSTAPCQAHHPPSVPSSPTRSVDPSYLADRL